MAWLWVVLLACVASSSSSPSTALGKMLEDDKVKPLAEFLTPASCEHCADDIEDVLHNCQTPFVFVSPECVGALVYAAKDCGQCLCEVVAEQLPEDEVPQLCPYCAMLAVCTPDC